MSLTTPKEITWDNIEQTATINRAQGLTGKVGAEPIPRPWWELPERPLPLREPSRWAALSFAPRRRAAGQFTVPPFVTLAMPAVGSSPATGNFGEPDRLEILYQIYIAIPGVDLSIFNSTTGIGRNVGFQ